MELAHFLFYFFLPCAEGLLLRMLSYANNANKSVECGWAFFYLNNENDLSIMVVLERSLVKMKSSKSIRVDISRLFLRPFIII